ncbi:hypothetical protein [Streptomyces sp. NPDC051561]|uniref:hypothetical protein n=1 Tax=Streptomyces sp. NPDC051561 TaxID=3365658 RepID=UPI0037B3A2F8
MIEDIDPTVVPELDSTLQKTPQWAEEHALVLLQGLPEGESLVHTTTPAQLAAPAFIALAARAGAPILYCGPDILAGADLPADEEFKDLGTRFSRPDHALLENLVEQLSGEQGRCRELTLSFVVAGVLHVWRADAAWWVEITDQLSGLEEKYEQRPATEATTPPEDPRSTPQEANRLAGLLEDLPSFREATKNAERERIVLRELPQLQSVRRTGLSWLGHDAMTEATLRVAEATKRIYTEFSADLPKLATELMESGRLDPAANAAARRSTIRAFVQERSGGYPPTKEFVELLYGEPALRKARP